MTLPAATMAPVAVATHSATTPAGLRSGAIGRRASAALCLLVAGGIWLTFYPGLFSPDSIDQYGQVLRGQFHDWHPPIMAIVLSGLFALGGHVAVLLLMQCIAGLLGVRALAFELLSLASGERIRLETRHWIATGIALFLLMPLSPLAFYLMTFWKDAWFAILLLWCGALAARLYRRAAESTAAGDAARLLALLVLMGVAPLVRHNALVTLPVLCVLAGVAASRRFGRLAAAAAFLPLLTYFSADWGMYRCLRIDRTHPENQIKALDLIGVCALDPSARAALPFTAAHLADDFDPARYRFGNVGPLLWDAPLLVKPGYVQGGPHDELGREYWLALGSHPWQIAETKLRAFANVVGVTASYYWCQRSITPNDSGLTPLSWTAPIRDAWVALSERIPAHPRWRWVGAVPAVWLGLNLVLLAVAALRPGGTRAVHILLLLLPLSYAASYLLATPAHDFRLTYPATLFVQVYAAAGFVSLCLRRAIPPSHAASPDRPR